MLGLPDWIVAAGSLPRAMPRGPKASELVRVARAPTGWASIREALLRPVRRRQAPPPVIEDPPTSAGGDDYWMF